MTCFACCASLHIEHSTLAVMKQTRKQALVLPSRLVSAQRVCSSWDIHAEELAVVSKMALPLLRVALMG